MNGFDMTSIWYIDNTLNGGYIYPILVSELSTHDIVVEIITEGINHTDNETNLSGGTVTNSAGFHMINRDMHNQSIDNIFYIKVLHNSNSLVLTTVPSTSNMYVEYYTIALLLNGASVFAGNGNVYEASYTFDASVSTYSHNNKLTIVFSKDFIYTNAEFINEEDKTKGTITKVGYTKPTTTYTNLVDKNAPNGSSNYFSSAANTYGVYILQSSDYYYINSSSSVLSGSNSIVTFTFESTDLSPVYSEIEGMTIGYKGIEFLGWKFIPKGQNDHEFIIYIDEDGNVTYDIVNTVKFTSAILNANINMTSSVYTNENLDNSFVNKSIMTMNINSIFEGTFVPVLDTVYSLSVNESTYEYNASVDEYTEITGKTVSVYKSDDADKTSVNNMFIPSGTDIIVTLADVYDAEGKPINSQTYEIDRFTRRAYNEEEDAIVTYYYVMSSNTLTNAYYIIDSDPSQEKHSILDTIYTREIMIYNPTVESKEVDGVIEYGYTYFINFDMDQYSYGYYTFYLTLRKYEITTEIALEGNSSTALWIMDEDGATYNYYTITTIDDVTTMTYYVEDDTYKTYEFGVTNPGFVDTAIYKHTSLAISTIYTNNKLIITYAIVHGSSLYYELTPMVKYRLNSNDIYADNIFDRNNDILGSSTYSGVKYTKYYADANYSLLSYKLKYNAEGSLLELKDYTYKFGIIGSDHEHMKVYIEYEKDYWDYFDQMGFGYSDKLVDSGYDYEIIETSNELYPYTTEQIEMYRFTGGNSNATATVNGLTRNTAFVLSSHRHMSWLLYLIKNNITYEYDGSTYYYKDAYYYIDGNIDLAEKFWHSIPEFTGTMDMVNGNVISNIYIYNNDNIFNSDCQYIGFISNLTYTGKLIGLAFDNFVIEANTRSNLGIVAGLSSGYMQNIKITNSSIKYAGSITSFAEFDISTNYDGYVGGIIGVMSGGQLLHSSIESTSIQVTTYIGQVGGMVGAILYNNGVIANSYASVYVDYTGVNTYAYVGGVIYKNTGVITNVVSNGTYYTGVNLYYAHIAYKNYNNGVIDKSYANGKASTVLVNAGFSIGKVTNSSAWTSIPTNQDYFQNLDSRIWTYTYVSDTEYSFTIDIPEATTTVEELGVLDGSIDPSTYGTNVN
ncbi:MAG: hypothetical protein IJW28_01860, partial [Clostridia bacterium]|nr:hypothetical protein [Clostridia bacterium]